MEEENMSSKEGDTYQTHPKSCSAPVPHDMTLLGGSDTICNDSKIMVIAQM